MEQLNLSGLQENDVQFPLDGRTKAPPSCGIFMIGPLKSHFCQFLFYNFPFSLVGFAPFWHRRQMQMIRNITEGKFKFGSPEWDDISELPKDLVSFLCSFLAFPLSIKDVCTFTQN